MAAGISNTLPNDLQAHRVQSVGPLKDGTRLCIVSVRGHTLIAGTVSVGDYYVIPSDGHPYVMTKARALTLSS